MCVCVCVCVCVCACVRVCHVIGLWYMYLFYLSSDNVVLELKCDKLVKILQVLHTLPDLYIIC